MSAKVAESPTRERRRGDLKRIVHNLTPVDLLWLRTTVEDELLRRGFKPAPLHKLVEGLRGDLRVSAYIKGSGND